MAQTIVITRVESDSYADVVDVFGSTTPDKEEAEVIAKDNELSGYITCSYVCYNLGEGESDMDTFISDEDLEKLWKESSSTLEFEEKVMKATGKEDMGVYSSGSFKIYVSEDEEEDW